MTALPPNDTLRIAKSTYFTIEGDPIFHSNILPQSYVDSIVCSNSSHKM
jgi:hypothetical protein